MSSFSEDDWARGSQRGLPAPGLRHSFCVDDPKIADVRDVESGEILPAHKAIGNDYDKLEGLRMGLRESIIDDNPRYVCPICGTGVYLICARHGDEKRFHFRHALEDGRCPAVTRGALSADQISACKYNGAKESQAHLQMKRFIEQSLRCDPNFSTPDVEKVWKGQDRTSWRKPDVSAVWRNSLPVAFEIQLSTTFLHVIAERRRFYLKNGGLLVWVFKSFNESAARMTQDDVFYNNNRNLFLASEETLAASQKGGAFMLDCRWALPTIGSGGRATDEWDGRRARFSELTLDLPRQRAYLIDCDEERKRRNAEAADAPLRSRFEAWWTASESPALGPAWYLFREEFWNRGIVTPEWPSHIYALLNALYSAKHGRPIGFRHLKLISVAHTIADHHLRVIQPFRAALLVYDRAKQLRDEDSIAPGESETKWMKKVRFYRTRFKERDRLYTREEQYDPLIAFLFPEVGEQLTKWDAEEDAH